MSFDDCPVHLSRPGSRFTIVPERHNSRIRVLPLGYSLPEETGFSITIDSLSGITGFPAHNETQTKVATHLTPTSATFTIPLPETHAEVRYEIVSPFTPALDDWRIAPVMFVSITLVNNDTDTLTCNVSLNGLQNLQHQTAHTNGFSSLSAPWNRTITQRALMNQDIQDHIAPHLIEQRWESPSFHEYSSHVNGVFMAGGYEHDGWAAEQIADTARLTVELTAKPGESQQRHAVILFHTASPVLLVDGRQCRFAYLRDFPNPGILMAQALNNRDRLLQEDLRMRASIVTATSTESFIALAHSGLQSFLACSWLVRSPDGSLRYSEWEGFPLFHSTMDVVFNTSPFHLAWTPEFLADMLRHWPRYHLNGDMPHDMGKGLIIRENSYPVKMKTEENANYLLLHSMYAARTGDLSVAEYRKTVLEQVIQRLLDMDTDGNGLPNRGVINTFDDAPLSINMAENQVYLGIKKAAALQATAMLFDTLISDALRVKALARADIIYQSIIASWTGTHFPIALPAEKRETTGARRVTRVLLPHDDSHPVTTDELLDDGIDGFSNYAAHGLVALWLSGLNAPPELETLMKQHLETAHKKTATDYGDAHRDGIQNVWVSQNMWRDLAALYLNADLDFDLLHQRYLRVQKEAVPRRDGTGRWDGFCDSPFNSFLTAYSRGIPVLGYHWVAPGTITLPEINRP